MTPFWPGRPAHRDALEAHGAVDVFSEPALYDATYRRRTHDVDHYCARVAGVPRVLELGCGSGRVTLPLARAGTSVVAVDRAAVMVEALADRLGREPPEVGGRVRAVVADLRRLSLPDEAPFPLVLCPFNTFLHLYDRHDVAAALEVVRRQLAPGGRFVFDTSMPRSADLRDRRARGRAIRFRGRRYRYDEVFAYEPLEQILYVTCTWTPDDGGRPLRQLLAHRQFFAAELEALLHASGFEVVGATEWGRPLSRDPDAVVWECAARG